MTKSDNNETNSFSMMPIDKAPLSSISHVGVSLQQSLGHSAALPDNLKRKSYDEDIFERMKKSPIPNPSLTKPELKRDPEKRELVRQVMAACSEREKEILLHNQARVFSEMLIRLKEKFINFLNKPFFVPNSWAEYHRDGEAGYKNNVTEERSQAKDNSIEEKEKSPKSSFLKRFIAAILTPKYILGTIAAAFAIFAGYSQIQIKSLESAISSYKKAAEAAEISEKRLNEQIKAIGKERDHYKAEIDDLTNKKALVEKEKHDLKLEKVELQQTNIHLKDQIVHLEKQFGLAKTHENSRILELRKTLNQKGQELLVLKTEYEKVKAKLEKLQARNNELESNTSKFMTVAEDRTTQIDELINTNRKLVLENQRLKTKVILLSFAETCIERIWSQVSGTYSKPDKKDIKQALKEYRAAKKNLKR